MDTFIVLRWRRCPNRSRGNGRDRDMGVGRRWCSDGHIRGGGRRGDGEWRSGVRGVGGGRRDEIGRAHV